MKIKLRLVLLVSVMTLYGFEVSLAQNYTRQNDLIRIQVQNAKKIYNNGDGRRAIKLLEYLLRNNPKDIEINYLLSILYLKVKKDLRGMKKYYEFVKKYDQNYKSPRDLTEVQIAAYFQPQQYNIADINLKKIFSEVEKNIKRDKWLEARTIFNSGSDYREKGSSPQVNKYMLLGLYIYDHYDSLYLGLQYYSGIEEDFLFRKDDKEMFNSLKHKWQKKYKQFKAEFLNRQKMLKKLNQLIEQERFKKALIFNNLVMPLYQNDSRVEALLKLSRVQCFVALDRLSEARTLTNKLYRSFSTQNFPVTFADRLKKIETRLLFKESKIRIGGLIKEANSLFYQNLISEGINRYKNIIEEQQKKNLNTDFIYVSLSRVLKDVGYYDKARDYLESLPVTFADKQLTDALADTINKCEQFEINWQKQMQRNADRFRNFRFQKLRKSLIELIRSPFLRYGLKDSTYSMLAQVYYYEGKIEWARNIASFAQRYSASDKNRTFISGIDSIQRTGAIHPLITPFKKQFSIKIKHPQTVQVQIFALKPGNIEARQPENISRIRILPLQTYELKAGKSLLVDCGEKQTSKNYVLGLGSMIVSLLFILAR